MKLLAECGLGVCDIAKLFIQIPRIITASPERVLRMVACTEGIGVPCGSGMFRQALHAVSCLREEEIAAKVEQLKKTLRRSDAEVRIALCKWPIVLRRSKDMLQLKSEFLISKVGVGTGIHRSPACNARS
jgi:mTERF domain-containing protein, mitochondrial